MAILCVIGVSSFVACSDDNEPENKPENVKIAAGSYTGVMGYTIEGTDEVKGSDVDWTVTEVSATSGSVDFANFPVRDLIVAILGEDGADAIIEAIGPVAYSVKYNSVVNSDKSEIALNFAPEALVLKVGEMEVKVTILTPEAGNYNVAIKSMDFQLKATEVTLAGTTMENFKPITLRFSTKKVTEQ